MVLLLEKTTNKWAPLMDKVKKCPDLLVIVFPLLGVYVLPFARLLLINGVSENHSNGSRYALDERYYFQFQFSDCRRPLVTSCYNTFNEVCRFFFLNQGGFGGFVCTWISSNRCLPPFSCCLKTSTMC